jgi:type IV pilus assembly protein PilQ
MKSRQRCVLRRALGAVMATLAAWSPAHAATLTGIDFAATPAGGVQLQIQADGALPPSKAFLISDPPRLVIDLPSADSAIAERTKKIDTGPVVAVAVVPGEGRTRLVVNLVEAVKWSMTTADNRLLVMLDAPGTAAVGARAPPVGAAAPPR